MAIYGYVRVSTDKQDLSVDAQIERIKGYASAYGIEVAEIIVDDGRSAKNLEREGLQSILAREDMTGIIFTKLDRLTRSVRDLGELLEGALKGKQLISISEHLDTQSASGRLMLNLLVSVSSWEREVIGERTSAVMQDMKRRGLAVTRPPFGKVIGEDGKLADCPKDGATRAQILTLRGEGLSYRAISARLAAEGRTKDGKPLVATLVERVCKAG